MPVNKRGQAHDGKREIPDIQHLAQDVADIEGRAKTVRDRTRAEQRDLADLLQETQEEPADGRKRVHAAGSR